MQEGSNLAVCFVRKLTVMSVIWTLGVLALTTVLSEAVNPGLQIIATQKGLDYGTLTN